METNVSNTHRTVRSVPLSDSFFLNDFLLWLKFQFISFVAESSEPTPEFINCFPGHYTDNMKVLVLLDVLSDVSGKQCNQEKHSEDKGDVSKTHFKNKNTSSVPISLVESMKRNMDYNTASQPYNSNSKKLNPKSKNLIYVIVWRTKELTGLKHL